MNARMRRTLIALGMVLLAMLLLMPPGGPRLEVSRPHSEDRGAEGLLGLYRWLERRGIRTRSLRVPLDTAEALPAGAGHVLLLHAPGMRNWSAEESKTIHTWVRQGNTLLMFWQYYDAPPRRSYHDVPRPFKDLPGWTLSFQPDNEQAQTPTRPRLARPLDDDEPRHWHRFDSSSEPAALAGLQLRYEHPAAPDLRAPLGMGSKPRPILGRHIDQAAAGWYAPVGERGHAMLIALGRTLGNDRLDLADHAEWAERLLRIGLAEDGMVLFDDYRHGLSEVYNPRDFWADGRLHTSLLIALLLWLLYVAGVQRSLLPTRVLPSRRPHTVHGLTSLLARKVDEPEIARRLILHWQTERRRRRGLPPSTDLDIDWLRLDPSLDAAGLTRLHGLWNTLAGARPPALAAVWRCLAELDGEHHASPTATTNTRWKSQA